MKKSTKRKYILGATVALVVVILGIGVVHQVGYVFSGPYLVKGGTLTITDARPQSDVFIDNHRIGSVNGNGTATFSGISLGERNVIVASENTWPWIFDFVSSSGEEVVLAPLQVFEDAQGEPIAADDSATIQRITSLFNDYREPIQANPLKRDANAVWVEGTQVFVRMGNDDVHSVYSSQQPIRNISWFKNRDDVIVIASQHTVFALDLRESSVQNFQPIYTGSEPYALVDPEETGSVIVREGEQYLRITL